MKRHVLGWKWNRCDAESHIASSWPQSLWETHHETHTWDSPRDSHTLGTGSGAGQDHQCMGQGRGRGSGTVGTRRVGEKRAMPLGTWVCPKPAPLPPSDQSQKDGEESAPPPNPDKERSWFSHCSFSKSSGRILVPVLPPQISNPGIILIINQQQ